MPLAQYLGCASARDRTCFYSKQVQNEIVCLRRGGYPKIANIWLCVILHGLLNITLLGWSFLQELIPFLRIR
jgi:hypothetical protein